MIVGFKDGFKLIGISIVSFCAVFVCTFFLNFYIDAQAIESAITENLRPLYDAQTATCKFVCAICGGFLGMISVIMLTFYIKLYIESHCREIGIMKALGYSDVKISAGFCMFGLSVLVGVAAGFAGGFAIMPIVYENMVIDGLPEIPIKFHPVLLICLVFVPAILFSLLSWLFAYLSLRRPVMEMIRDKKEIKVKSPKKVGKSSKERSFLLEMGINTLSAKKILVFFVAFASFCFSAMVQMGLSMEDLSSWIMGGIILGIGLILAFTAIIMAVTSLVNANVKNIAVMKAFGYSSKECALTVFGGYAPFALAGFAVGTVYQFGLLSLMVNIVYKDVVAVPDYAFNVPAFFIALASFVVFYAAVNFFYAFKISKVSVKTIMQEY